MRYRACEATVTNRNLPLTTARFVCRKSFRCLLIPYICMYTACPHVCAAYVSVCAPVEIELLVFTSRCISRWQPVCECAYIYILFYGYFVCSCPHVYRVYVYISDLAWLWLRVLTCMWKQWGLIHPRGVLSEGCAVSAARLSRPCTEGSMAFLLMAFMGRSQAANEQPWHQNDESMTWNQAGVTVGTARVRLCLREHF